MRAIVFVTGQMEGGLFEGDRNSVSLMWLVDRPVIQRICEGLVARGVSTIDWVHQQANEKTIHFLGDGRRWGVRFRHHAAGFGESVYGIGRSVFATCEAGEGVIVGHANRFLDIEASSLSALSEVPVRLFDSFGIGSAWTGWAVIAGRVGAATPGSVSNLSDFENYLTSGPAGSYARESISRGYAVHSVDSYLQATREILSAEYPEGRIRIPRSARVHSTARIVGPVCVGPGAEIGAHAVVGPHVVIGPNSIIDRNAVVTNSVVFPFSYVSRDLRLNQAVVDRNRVLGPASSGHALVDDRAPVACLESRPFSRVRPSAIAVGTVGLLQKVGRLPTRMFRKRPFAKASHVNGPVIPAVAN